jgi:hypothetical protein
MSSVSPMAYRGRLYYGWILVMAIWLIVVVGVGGNSLAHLMDIR